MSVVQKVTDCLQSLSPLQLAITDKSDAHRHHAEGGSGAHLVVRVVSARFEGLPSLKRHRLVYDCVGALPAMGIHALAITALTPAEAEGAEDSPRAAHG